MVEDLLTATSSDERGSLAYELSELMYDAPTLDVLEPMFQSSDPEHARVLVAILFEHGNRSHEVVRWIDEYLDHEDEHVRFRAAGCAMNLDPTQHPRTIGKLIEKLRDTPLNAATVAEYLSWVALDDLNGPKVHLSGGLRELITWLQGGEYDDWKRLYREGRASALIAVAALGRHLPPEFERLEDARESGDEAVALAARRVSERVRR